MSSAKNGPIFILRPTSGGMWHKAVFKVGPVAGPKPNVTGSSKNASAAKNVPIFILRPTSKGMWHKAIFKVGPVAGPKPNTEPWRQFWALWNQKSTALLKQP